MTALELDTYAKLIHALALTMHEFQTSDVLPTINEPPPYFYTWHMSLLERSASFLWKLKILRPLDGAHGTLFKLDCDLAEVPAIAKKNAANGPTLDNLVWLYIELRSEYSLMHLDRSTQFFIDGEPAFSLGEEESAAFEALKELGYLKAIPGGYASTARTETLLSKPWWEE